jgi:hypothetical protein
MNLPKNERRRYGFRSNNGARGLHGRSTSGSLVTLLGLGVDSDTLDITGLSGKLNEFGRFRYSW